LVGCFYPYYHFLSIVYDDFAIAQIPTILGDFEYQMVKSLLEGVGEMEFKIVNFEW